MCSVNVYRTHVPVAAVLVLSAPDDGRLRPKHVEWLCRNKTCTVLHQVGVSFDVNQRLITSYSSSLRHIYCYNYYFLSFSDMIQMAVSTQNMTNDLNVPPFYFMWKNYLSTVTLCNTSSFPTRWLQMIFTILLQNHISKLSRYFWSTSRSVQVPAPHKVM